MDFSGFPLCANGDVLIVLSNDDKLQLHSDILRRHSKFFKERITQQNAATLSSTAIHKHKETVRWRFDLLDKPEADGEGAGHLIPIVSIFYSSSLFHAIIRYPILIYPPRTSILPRSHSTISVSLQQTTPVALLIHSTRLTPRSSPHSTQGLSTLTNMMTWVAYLVSVSLSLTLVSTSAVCTPSLTPSTPHSLDKAKFCSDQSPPSLQLGSVLLCVCAAQASSLKQWFTLQASGPR
jgi:hypothetical protein